MRKFLLLALFVALSYVANQFFATGLLPLLPQPRLTKEERTVRELKERFLEATHRYESLDPENDFLPFYDFPSPEWALAETDEIERELNLVRSKITSESGMAEVGWLSMALRKFRKRVEADHAN